jgi:hypothetical protein
MSDHEFVPPIEFVQAAEVGESGWRLNLEAEERSVLARLLGELQGLLTDEENEATKPLLRRLFPPAFLDDEEKEAEYQRLMREELVASRVASIEIVTDILQSDDTAMLSENETMAFMQSINAVRLVLGSMLNITDDESAEVADNSDSSEHHLYGYLGWLLDWTVRSLTN